MLITPNYIFVKYSFTLTQCLIYVKPELRKSTICHVVIYFNSYLINPKAELKSKKNSRSTYLAQAEKELFISVSILFQFLSQYM